MTDRTAKRFRYGDRRFRAEPRDGGRWRVVEETLTPCGWRLVGHELVETLELHP